jgi:hypothetical protein
MIPMKPTKALMKSAGFAEFRWWYGRMMSHALSREKRTCSPMARLSFTPCAFDP